MVAARCPVQSEIPSPEPGEFRHRSSPVPNIENDASRYPIIVLVIIGNDAAEVGLV